MGIDFIDLKAQQRRIKSEIDAGIAKVLAEGRYIMGPEVKEFEANLANFGQAKHALGCANGTDALILPMLAWGIGPGDAVFCPSFTYCATAEIVAHVGATPVFVDINRDTYNMDAASLEQAIEAIKAEGKLTPRAVIAVDLFGQSADYATISPIVKAHGLKLVADSAQGFGTTLNGKHKYDNIRVGMNSRLDTLQAAILLPKLAIFADEIASRNLVAKRYIDGLTGKATRVPTVLNGVISTWAQFTIEVPDHAAFSTALKEKGIPTARYYPKPVHMQTAYANFPVAPKGLPNTMDCIENIVSLPMHPYLDETTQDMIIETAKAALG